MQAHPSLWRSWWWRIQGEFFEGFVGRLAVLIRSLQNPDEAILLTQHVSNWVVGATIFADPRFPGRRDVSRLWARQDGIRRLRADRDCGLKKNHYRESGYLFERCSWLSGHARFPFPWSSVR